mmetsp:Transcript_38502/g.99505  ORF Transcript_38502/g.99505 Transcript_38502/m.99505 type:complete len:315 (-) Transcript_38502:229-1173(-)
MATRALLAAMAALAAVRAVAAEPDECALVQVASNVDLRQARVAAASSGARATTAQAHAQQIPGQIGMEHLTPPANSPFSPDAPQLMEALEINMRTILTTIQQQATTMQEQFEANRGSLPQRVADSEPTARGKAEALERAISETIAARVPNWVTSALAFNTMLGVVHAQQTLSGTVVQVGVLDRLVESTELRTRLIERMESLPGDVAGIGRLAASDIVTRLRQLNTTLDAVQSDADLLAPSLDTAFGGCLDTIADALKALLINRSKTQLRTRLVAMEPAMSQYTNTLHSAMSALIADIRGAAVLAAQAAQSETSA